MLGTYFTEQAEALGIALGEKKITVLDSSTVYKVPVRQYVMVTTGDTLIRMTKRTYLSYLSLGFDLRRVS